VYVEANSAYLLVPPIVHILLPPPSLLSEASYRYDDTAQTLILSDCNFITRLEVV